MDQEQVTPTTEWRGPRNSHKLCELPSGNKALLRRTLEMLDLIGTGQIPNPLAKIINDAIAAASLGDPQAAALDMKKVGTTETEDGNAMLQFMDMVNRCVPNVFVKPRVLAVPKGEDPATWQPTEADALSIEDLSWDDRVFAFTYGQGGASDLAQFLDETRKAMGLAQAGGAVPLPSEPAGGSD